MRNSVALVLVCLAFTAVAQQKKLSEKQQQRLNNADHLFKNAHYSDAIAAYQEVLEADRHNMDIQLKIAEASFRLPDMEQAREWYKEAFTKSETGLPATVPAHHLYNYAELLLSDGQFDEALRWFELYKQRAPDDTRTDRKIKGILKMGELRKEALYEVAEVSFNSPYPDFSPAFYDSGLVFVSGREEANAAKEKKSAQHGAYLDLYYTRLQPDSSFSKPERIGDVLNSDFHEGPSVFYDNDRKVIFTRNNLNSKLRRSEEAVVIHLQLFSAERDPSGKTWKEPVLLPINNKDYSIGHPAVSSDGQYLYFSSNMPGGYGGTDLYVSRQSNNSWSTPENLGHTVNTEGNEMFPFLQGDTTLYFASTGHAGFGGLDIYRFNLEKKQEVENLGYPVNSNKDDFGLILNKKANKGYFSSNRKSNDADRDDHIYSLSINVPQSKPAPPLVVQVDTVNHEEYYTIQIFALRKHEVIRRSLLQDLKQVLLHEGKDGFNRYTYGKYNSIQGAIEMLQKIKAMGYNDAFVRKETRYKELSKKSGVEVEKLYKH